MLLQEIYQKIISVGIDNDIRSHEEINYYLKEQKDTFAALSDKEKQFYDHEKFTNPYSDTRILFGTGKEEIKSILVGIDVETQDLILASQLKANGMQIDAVLTHHPEGKALIELSEVMHLQEDMLNKMGVPVNLAQDLLGSRIFEVKRALLPYNYHRSITAAKLLNLPFLCAHTPADNCVQKYLEDLFAKENPLTLQDIVECLLSIPEYQYAAKEGAGPTITLGDKKRKAGKIFVDMTGGTSGSDEIYQGLLQAGVGTIIGMHMPEKHRKEAEKYHINVVIAGHMASDSLGMNLLLDQVLTNDVEVIGFAGFTRVKR